MRVRLAPRVAIILGMLAPLVATQTTPAQLASDPRVGLRAGWLDAGEAIRNMEVVSRTARPEGFFDPKNPGSFRVMNSDLAFKGSLAFQGSFNGFMVWDIS